MTDRISSITVALAEDIRVDDVEPLLNAIRQLRGVIAVEGNVSDTEQWMATARVRHEISIKLWEVLYPKKG